MHIVMFADQHAETLGGAQVSIRMQRRYLERAGHTVSIVAPRRHSRRPRNADDPGYVDLPSVRATIDGEYAFTWTGPRTDAAVERGLAGRPEPDLVHVQADFWAGFLGYRYARRHGLPVVHTMHNRVDVGLRATAPFPELVLRALNTWRRRALPGTCAGSDGWAYLRGLAEGAAAVTAPSEHFARRLERHGVFPHVDAIWNGMDDEILDRMLARPVDRGSSDVPTFVWVGRMSPEKRLLPFLEAVARAGVRMRVEVIGGGLQFGAARRLVARYGLGEMVSFLGGRPYEETLERIAAADALVQTSIGFETQGMTPFEAAALGTPSVMSDPDIAAEVGDGVWHVGTPGRADASVDALAAALRRAAGDIRAGAAPVPDPTVRDRFRQSTSTARMLEVYARVLTD